MKLVDKLRSLIADGESVVSDEMGVVSPAWRNFLPKWNTYSMTKKVLAIGVPVLTVLVLYGVGLNALELAAKHTIGRMIAERPESAIRAELASLKTTVEQLRKDVDAKASRIAVDAKPSVEDIAGIVKANAPTMLEFNQLQDDVRQVETELGALNKKSAPITTGSIAPKKKRPAPPKSPPSLTDPSSWTILP